MWTHPLSSRPEGVANATGPIARSPKVLPGGVESRVHASLGGRKRFHITVYALRRGGDAVRADRPAGAGDWTWFEPPERPPGGARRGRVRARLSAEGATNWFEFDMCVFPGERSAVLATRVRSRGDSRRGPIDRSALPREREVAECTSRRRSSGQETVRATWGTPQTCLQVV